MVDLRVRDCPTEGPEFEAVLRLLKLAKQTVGFLPDQALQDRAGRGTLLVAVADEDVRGYLLYDLPRDEIRIVQLVVAPSSRRSGVARLLVEEAVSRHPTRRGIGLECRRDFEANAVWSCLDFAPLNERPGRSAERKPLTTWWRDFGHPTLFSLVGGADERPVAALDANVVIDLADGANTPSRHVVAEWLTAACRLGVTNEVYVEIERHDNEAARVRHKRYALGLEQLGGQAAAWRSIEAAVAARLGERASGYATDIRHSAKASVAGARWFVTRDDRFRRACAEDIFDLCGLSVTSPSAFLLEVDRVVRDDIYRPADLDGSDIEVRPLNPGDLDEAARAFVNQPEGERLRDLRARLNDYASDTRHARINVFARERDLLALSVSLSDSDEIAVCRVRRSRAQETLARHMLGWLRTTSVTSRTIRLTDAACGPIVARAARDEGFLDAPYGRTAFVVIGRGSIDDLRDAVRGLVDQLAPASVPAVIEESIAAAMTPSAETALSLEGLFHPYVVVGAGLPTFLVPIKHRWAADLLDPSLSREQLFPRPTAMALQREHVYYRSPRSSGGLTAPGRILWYVSGSAPGARTIRAVSHLLEIVVGDPRRLFRRFSHLGVYTYEQVQASAVDGSVMALRFSRTRPLEHPVTLDEYRRLVARESGRGVSVVGPQPIDEHLFVQLISMSQ